mgnify:CR=1 FL=1
MRKINLYRAVICYSLFLFLVQSTRAQTYKDGKFLLDEEGALYLKLSFVSQFWARNGIYNPGSTVFGYAKAHGTDVGIRRFRLQLFGQLSDRVFFYSQFGENNYNSISDRKPSFFVHDIYSEYSIVKTKLSLGGGLSGWSGFGRFASPAVASILGLDAPLYQQTTNDVTDQFLRKLGVFVKGKFGRFDYRVMVAQPLAFQKSANYSAEVTRNANFSGKPPELQWNGYFQYQMKGIESNSTPYMTGSYLGKKSVLNIGIGIEYQKNATWYLSENTKDTLQSNLLMIGMDVFLDVPISDDGQALNFYVSAGHLDYGPGYIRNLGVMNPVNGNTDKNILNGGGFAFPAYGTGNVFYCQLGYKFKDNLIGSTTLMPYFSIESAAYQRLSEQMNFISSGLTWLIDGHHSKLTLAYENRPVYNIDGMLDTRLGSGIMQYQILF